MIELFDFQHQAAAQIAERFAEYLKNPPLRGTRKRERLVPFYQALSAITGAGKTAILAEAVSQIAPQLPIPPIVLWLSRGKVVVSQTYANLQDGGKYRHLLRDLDIRLLSEFDLNEVSDERRAFVYFATVGTFNQKDKELGERLIFRSEIDTAEKSTWDALTVRELDDGRSRPLIVVYDEAHNLSDQQVGLLMELEPHGFLVASATMRLPSALEGVLQDLRDEGWNDDELTTAVSPSDVAASGLIKSDIVLGGYEAAMEKTIDDLLADMRRAARAAESASFPLDPKAIYVCKTNVKETNTFQKDDPKRPFRQREAPPILIWRYLTEEKKIPSNEIAVYANLEFDNRHFPPPSDFVLFKGGDKDYDLFTRGGFRHIIFNLTLQEGWDDPACYFAYVDKSMGSRVQIAQIIGRVLRQPRARRFEHELLNSARFYVRVDGRGVFAEIVDDVRAALSKDGLEIELSSYVAGTKAQPKLLDPRLLLQVPHVALNAEEAHRRIQKIIDDLPDFGGGGRNTVGQGARALVRHRIGNGGEAEVKWIPYEHNNTVSARWIFQLEVSKQYPLALNVARSDDPKFDARIEVNSPAYSVIVKSANQVVDTYLQYVVLEQRVPNPYVVGEISVDPSKAVRFKNSVHSQYSGLNRLETDFARALDRCGTTWARNPSQSGFSIPLFVKGQSRNFYPDFLAWKDRTVFALDTTGQHLLRDRTGTKLLDIVPKRGIPKLKVRLVSEDQWNEKVERVAKGGYTVWSLGQGHQLRFHYFDTLDAAVRACLKS